MASAASQGEPSDDPPSLANMRVSEATAPEASQAGRQISEANIPQILEEIKKYLGKKKDTPRFVGLTLLVGTLGNSPALQQDKAALLDLWKCLPSKFLDRLIMTGCANKDSAEMLNVAVGVIHSFVVLLPEDALREGAMINRIGILVSSLRFSSKDTTKLILQTLITLVNLREGAGEFMKLELETYKALVTLAPTNEDCLEVFSHAWLTTAAQGDPESRRVLGGRIDESTSQLVNSFSGTDAVTLLAFLVKMLANIDSDYLPSNPKWVPGVIKFVQNLVVSRPNRQARTAYTNVAGLLLRAYRPLVMPLLFRADDPKLDKPFCYFFINLLLIDIRTTLPTLLEKLNHPDYGELAARMTSALDIVGCFVAYLVEGMEGDDRGDEPPILPPDLILKLRKGFCETMSITIEYLRDRWDAAVAGAKGLHPDARVGAAETSMGSRLTLTWDSKTEGDIREGRPFISAVATVAFWIREDDNEALRMEAAGLLDMWMDLYQNSPTTTTNFEYRGLVIFALEGITASEEGIESFLAHGGWATLSKDLISSFLATARLGDVSAALRGIDVVQILLRIVEEETAGTREEWMQLVKAVGDWDCPNAEYLDQPPKVQAFQADVLGLAAALFVNANDGMQRRFGRSASLIRVIAARLQVNQATQRAGGRYPPGVGGAYYDSFQDVIDTLEPFSKG